LRGFLLVWKIVELDEEKLPGMNPETKFTPGKYWYQPVVGLRAISRIFLRRGGGVL
jgi:hypothetical protein